MNVKDGCRSAALTLDVRPDAKRSLKRRAFLLAGAAAAALACIRGARAQSRQQPVLIAWLNSESLESGGVRYLAAFREGLATLGWKEGQQYVIEERWADGR